MNLAVFIDFDNIEIGVKSTLGEHFDVGTILEALRERGEVVTKIAYADWTRAGEYSRALTQHAIRLVQRNLTPGGDKNGADINLALDALEMAFTHPHINAYVIVGGDSDFLSLVEKLKQYDKKVFVVGGRAFTSVILQRNCHEFIAYENLMRRPSSRGGRPAAPVSVAPITQAFPLVRRALKILADREVSPQTGLLKSTLLQLDSTFSERNYGASSFLDFTEKLSQAGLVALKHAGRSVMVELNPGQADESDGTARTEAAPAETVIPRQAGPDESTEASASATPAPQPSFEPFTPLGDQAQGVAVAASVLAAATNARWPMYLRNAKQIFRAAGFDERRYNFSGLIELLRACQREGLIRMERDRRGGLRVFQGPQLSTRTAPSPRIEPVDVSQEAIETPVVDGLSSTEEAPAVAASFEDTDEVIEIQPQAVVDTTAELLGRAKARRPRTRATTTTQASGTSSPRGARKTGTKKTAGPARRGGRTKKEVPDDIGNR
ncbi:MAG: NYN domain-containing protein [Vicinamibacterales bacterium]